MSSGTPLVAIVGRPNVGKSSLFNRLVGSRQAITFETAGTTRDPNYGNVSWRGHFFTLVDTAGLSRADGEIEAAAQEQIRQVADIADVIVLVVDAATMVTAEDQAAVQLARKTGKPVILALGKIDTAANADLAAFDRLGLSPVIGVSAVHGRGTGDLLDAITSHLTRTSSNERPADAPLRLALLGRPNVGKSSLLNALIGKQQAVVSQIAGTTRDLGRGQINYHKQPMEIIDTAGLRRRGRIERGIEQYSSMRTLGAIYQADICLLVIDAVEGPVAGDLNIAGQVLEAGRGLILVANKWDAVEKDERTQARMTRRLEAEFQFAHWAPLVYTSAVTGLHVAKIFELATEIHTRRAQQIATGPLNRLIEGMVAKQPPAGLKGRLPKINYATQTDHNPPTFTVFCTYPDLIHFSYRRYLENGLRAAIDFTGTPIKLEFRHKHGEEAGKRRRK